MLFSWLIGNDTHVWCHVMWCAEMFHNGSQSVEEPSGSCWRDNLWSLKLNFLQLLRLSQIKKTKKKNQTKRIHISYHTCSVGIVFSLLSVGILRTCHTSIFVYFHFHSWAAKNVCLQSLKIAVNTKTGYLHISPAECRLHLMYICSSGVSLSGTYDCNFYKSVQLNETDYSQNISPLVFPWFLNSHQIVHSTLSEVKRA